MICILYYVYFSLHTKQYAVLSVLTKDSFNKIMWQLPLLKYFFSKYLKYFISITWASEILICRFGALLFSVLQTLIFSYLIFVEIFLWWSWYEVVKYEVIYLIWSLKEQNWIIETFCNKCVYCLSLWIT